MGHNALKSGDPDEGERLLRRAAAGPLAEHHLISAHLGLFEIGIARHDRAMLDAIRTWLEGRHLTPNQHMVVVVSETWDAFYTGRWDDLSYHFDKGAALALAPDAGPESAVFGLSLGPEFLTANQGPDHVAAVAARLHRRLDQYSPAQATLTGTLGWRALMQHDLERCRHYLDRVAAICERHGGVVWTEATALCLRMALGLAEGDFEAVEQAVDTAISVVDSNQVYQLQGGPYGYGLARLLHRTGRVDEIGRRCEPLLRAMGPEVIWREADRATIDAMAADAAELARLKPRLEAAIEVHDRMRLFILHGFPRLELARLVLGAGDEHQARTLARPTLEFLADFDAFGLLAVDGDAHRDVLRLFADDPVLGPRLRPIVPSAAEPAPTVVQLPDTGETLSAREVEVLRLVARGRTNAEVADALFISERTVKSHMTSILRKTATANRTEAARLAATLGLV